MKSAIKLIKIDDTPKKVEQLGIDEFPILVKSTGFSEIVVIATGFNKDEPKKFTGTFLRHSKEYDGMRYEGFNTNGWEVLPKDREVVLSNE